MPASYGSDTYQTTLTDMSAANYTSQETALAPIIKALNVSLGILQAECGSYTFYHEHHSCECLDYCPLVRNTGALVYKLERSYVPA